MIDGLRPYAEMKPSGLPWLGDVPTNWEVRRNGRLFGSRRETGFPDLPVLEVSLRSGVRVRDFDNGTRKQEMGDRSKYQRAMRGDIAYNMMRMWQGAVGIAPVDGLVSPAYVVARPFAETDTAYYAYVFRTAAYMREVDTFSRGIVPDRNRLYWESFKQMPSVYPPLDEQRLIVRFLDWHGAQTAKLIRAKKKIIALLNEQKQAIIHRAVTRGLDPNVRLKPSGIPWLGDVPEGWEVKRLKNIADVVLGKMLTTEAKGHGDFKPYLRSTNVQWLTPDIQDIREMWILNAEKAQLRIRKDDLLVSEGGEVGRTCLWNDEIPECYIQNSVHRITVKPKMLPMFLLHQFFMHGKRGRFNSIVNRVSIAHLTREKLVTVLFAVPPLDQQAAIVCFIEEQIASLDGIIDRAQREIELIQEFRTRLIADVVTGKLDVRALAAGLPEATEPQPIDELVEDDDLDEVFDGAETEEEAA